MKRGDLITRTALAEVGYKESPAGSNMTKFGEWFGFNGKMWCAMFVCWVYWRAGFPFPKIQYSKGFAGVRNAYKYYEKLGKITDTPKVGCLVFMDFDGGGWDHIGIFNGWADVKNRVAYTIEGNTGAASQSNGGEVQNRTRDERKVKMAYAIPDEMLGDVPDHIAAKLELETVTKLYERNRAKPKDLAKALRDYADALDKL